LGRTLATDRAANLESYHAPSGLRFFLSSDSGIQTDMKATTSFILSLALSFAVVTIVGCNAAPAPTEKKAGDKPVKPGKRPANTTDK
jgi:hypothetical protein